MTVTGSNDSGAAAAASCEQGDAASSVLPCCSPGGDAGDPRPCCSMSLAMRNICSALRLSACTVLISGCFMGQPREFSFASRGRAKGTGKWGGKWLRVEAAAASLPDGEGLGAQTAPRGLQVWFWLYGRCFTASREDQSPGTQSSCHEGWAPAPCSSS